MTSNFPSGVSSFGMPVLPGVGIPFTGNVFFVDPVNGNDGNDGASSEVGRAFQTLYRAHGACVAGHNDVVFLIANGATSGAARLSLAGAVAEAARIGAAVPTTGKLIWSKNATHLIGICAPNGIAARARIAAPSGTYTAATFGGNDFVSVTAAGCMFQNFTVQDAFSTGNAAQRLWIDTGERNYYDTVHFDGQLTAAAAAAAASRSLVIDGGGAGVTKGEHKFVNCTIGGDTVLKNTAANASLEFLGTTPRNSFYNCVFPMWSSYAGSLFVLTTGATAIDRFVIFEDCKFIEALKSASGVTQTVVMSCDNAAPGGLILIHNCIMIGDVNINWGNAAALSVQFVQGAFAAATTGLGIAPT